MILVEEFASRDTTSEHKIQAVNNMLTDEQKLALFKENNYDPVDGFIRNRPPDWLKAKRAAQAMLGQHGWTCAFCSAVNPYEKRASGFCQCGQQAPDPQMGAALGSAKIKDPSEKKEEDLVPPCGDLTEMEKARLKELVTAVIKKQPMSELEQILLPFEGRGLVNGVFVQKDIHFTPLAYAVYGYDQTTCERLIALKAEVNVQMPSGDTALMVAIKNTRRDSTDMVRFLLSKGADHRAVKRLDAEAKANINLTMDYWLRQAEVHPNKRETREKYYAPLGVQRLPEIFFGVIGQRLAAQLMKKKIYSMMSDVRGRDHKPLVLALPGSPGLGKTWFSEKVARSIVPEEDLRRISFGSLHRTAHIDLFGADKNAFFGGKKRGGLIPDFLRSRQNRRSVLILDEFEKITSLTDERGHPLDELIYKTFLEPWQEGYFVDPSSGSGKKLECHNCIFLVTSNVAQDIISAYASEHADEVFTDNLSRQQISKIESELVEEQIKPYWRKKLSLVSPETGPALFSRIDAIIPFVPLTENEKVVLADSYLRFNLGRLYDPPLTGPNVPEEDQRGVGNLQIFHTGLVADWVSKAYNNDDGARSIKSRSSEIKEMCSDPDTAEEAEEKGEVVRMKDPPRDGRKLWVVFAQREGTPTIVYQEPAAQPSVLYNPEDTVRDRRPGAAQAAPEVAEAPPASTREDSESALSDFFN